ncbi:MAG: monovalent cation/H(+) antiporter subunit G [Gammaproteobacteria bacterium]|nr:monovalent cation/H(+) antiporter subunit G [Gammaproteobacteria bacterium]MDH3467538.1 monovalent cation/H(+) antiporter subunit G [Gammaproteobacteria bacterium]
MQLLLDAISWICLLSGGFFVVAGGIGLLRFPDFFTRLHAASVTDTLGTGLILLGLMLQSGFSQASVKLILILVFLFFSSPTAAHALAKAALHGKLVPFVKR